MEKDKEEQRSEGARWTGPQVRWCDCHPHKGSRTCQEHKGASASALQAYSSYLVSFSAPGGGSGLYKMSRQELETAAAVHLPGPCQILEITLALCQDASSTEKTRNGRGNLAIWSSNSCVYYITQISPCC